MKTILRLLCMLVFLCGSTYSFGQDISVSGKVTSSDGAGLPGASVLIKGTTAGVPTDVDGKFTISVPSKASVLVISMIGMTPQEVTVGSQTNIAVTLKDDSKSLDEVVVIGYGTATKRDLTGSIVKIKGDEISDKPNANPVASLQGRVAGLSVVNNGTPGKAPDIRIRGTNSIGAVSPLYVVDGILNDNIDYINPNDIESIEILKDPSSLAIFGVRGANGVIAITTKTAKKGRLSVNFNTSAGIKKLTGKIAMANATQFATLFAEERANNGVETPYDYTGLTSNTDWIDAVTRTAKFNNNSLSISSNTDRNKINIGMGYLVDEGIVKHEKLSKWLLSLNDEVSLSKNIKVGVSLNYSRQNNPYNSDAYFNSALDDARKVMPQVSANTKRLSVPDPYRPSQMIDMDIYSGLDVSLQNAGVVNPLLKLENEWNKTKAVDNRLVGSIYGEINFLKNFTYRGTIYGDQSDLNRRQYTPIYYAYNPKTDVSYLDSRTTKIKENFDSYRKYQMDHILTFKKDFGNHYLTLMGGFTTYYSGQFKREGNSNQFTDATALPIPNDKRFWYLTNGFENPGNTSITSVQSEYTTVSYLARMLYNYKDKYFLNASYRDDASSRLPPKNQHQQFWAIGAAWDVTQEDFMKSQHLFNLLKVKGSIGLLGNQTASKLDGTPLDYPYYPKLNTGKAAVFGTNVYNAADQEYLPSKDLKWETVNAMEFGIEVNAFQNRLHLEANYFDKTTKNLMTYVERSSIGLKNQLVNGGQIRNWGQEISASWKQPLGEGLVLNLGGNITFLNNNVKELSKELPTGVLIRGSQNNGSAESRTAPGHPIASFYGYVVEGIYQSYAEILASPVASSIGAYRPGDFKFKDVNNDGRITADDRTFIGNPTPDFTYGGSVGLSYKGISLGIEVGGVYGNQVFRTWGSLESPFQRVNYPADKMERWHGPGTSNWVPLVSQGDRFNYNGSTYNIEDGSYIRLRNIQLAYNFPVSVLSKLKMQNLRVFANAQNLKTWKNNMGYTPEYGGDGTSFGYDNAGGAIPYVITGGLSVNF